MKVLLANSSFHGGGITTYAHELVKCLSQDYELIVVIGDDSYRPITVPGVTVLHYDAQEISKENALFFIKLINEELKPDLIISSLGIIIPIIAPYLNDNIRIVTVSHSGRYFNSEYSVFNHQYIDSIIAASSVYNKRYLENKYHIKDKTKVRVIYNFMASDAKLENYRLIKKDNHPIQIIYAGGWFPVKTPDLVLKVLCELLKTDLDFKFYWTGETSIPFVYKQPWCKLIKIQDIRQFVPKDRRVEFTGRLASKTEFDELLASSNILISPSRNEGSSMLLLEALRSGSICIVGDYKNGNREVVENGHCGFVVNHRKPKEFVGIVSDMIRNKDNYAFYYDNAYKTYQDEHTYSVWKKQIDDLMIASTNHHIRKKISMMQLSMDVFRMRIKLKLNPIRRFSHTLESLVGYFSQYIRMRIKREFPKYANSFASEL